LRPNSRSNYRTLLVDSCFLEARASLTGVGQGSCSTRPPGCKFLLVPDMPTAPDVPRGIVHRGGGERVIEPGLKVSTLHCARA